MPLLLGRLVESLAPVGAAACCSPIEPKAEVNSEYESIPSPFSSKAAMKVFASSTLSGLPPCDVVVGRVRMARTSLVSKTPLLSTSKARKASKLRAVFSFCCSAAAATFSASSAAAAAFSAAAFAAAASAGCMFFALAFSSACSKSRALATLPACLAVYSTASTDAAIAFSFGTPMSRCIAA